MDMRQPMYKYIQSKAINYSIYLLYVYSVKTGASDRTLTCRIHRGRR